MTATDRQCTVISVDTCLKNASVNIEAVNGEHPTEHIKAFALVSMANSLLAIAATVVEVLPNLRRKGCL